MEDIRLALCLICLLSIVVFGVTCRLLRNLSKLSLDIAAGLLVLVVLAYVWLVWGQLWIVNWIPLPSVIVLSNWFPLLLSALAAVVWLRLGEFTVLRRVPILVVLISASIYSLTYFIPAEPPECGNEWLLPIPPMAFPLCKQTTDFTCSAAAAATLLNTVGVETTEQEMATLCLTRSGTTWLGLYHGLSTKLLGTSHRVEFFEGDATTIENMAAVHPVLLCCRLDPKVAAVIPDYVHEGGWIPGTAHSVVYFGRVNDRHIIGDPSRGYEMWRTRDLNALWTGTGLKLGHYDRNGNPAP